MTESSTAILASRPPARDRASDADMGAEVTVLELYAEIDRRAAAELGDRLLGPAERGEGVLVLDLSGATFTDPAAIGVLLSGLTPSRTGRGQLRLVVPSGEVRRVVRVSLPDRRFEMHATRADALAATPRPEPFSA